MPKVDDAAAAASQALLSAAVGGLLCIASAACSSSTITGPSTANTGSSTSAASPSASNSGSDSTSSSPAASASTSSSAPVVVNADTPVPDTFCDGGVPPNPMVTSSTVITTMTLDTFTTSCSALNGILEIQPHCGGSNACRGMSYDTTTQTLIEHTCRGLNSCAGYSCVICG